MKRFRCGWVLSLVASLWTVPLAAQSYSDAELLQNARVAWAGNQCVRAARFFFAYQLRNPPALRTDARHKAAVTQAIEWCERHARVQAGVDYKADGPDSPAVAVSPPPKPALQLQPANVAQDARARRCDVYATLAVTQSELNRRNRCGYTDNRWSSDYGVHFRWCSAGAAERSRAETSARQQLLEQCVP